jgi:hypothetical protein
LPLAVIRIAFLTGRCEASTHPRRFRSRLDSIAARYPPRILVDLDYLANMLSAITEGGIDRLQGRQ